MIATVGQRVQIPFGVGKVSGTIVEDRGPIGVGGRRLFLISIPNDPDDPDVVMRAEDELEDDTTQAEALTPTEIQAFLESGGLISILRRNNAGGAAPVWLCRDSLGNLTFTFTEERGLIGGAPIPFSSLHGDKVFKPRIPEVLEFLTGLGLSPKSSRAIISRVGHAPY